MASIDDDIDECFPKGLRVLVVDDDSTSLKLMDNLLRKCHYQVTTTNQAKEALRILKANKDKYDIVISDVEMPDMDGIKLLQLVGLEMDLPVIMLSAYSDTNRVMKGIRNGAVDYLVKPVRIQELQNIWQHVIRKRRRRATSPPTPAPGPGPGPSPAHRGVSKSAPIQIRNPTRTRTQSQSQSQRAPKGCSRADNDDNYEYENDEMEEDDRGRGNEDATTQKKPRLFWSVELHQKFVDAVNQLGLDKAFPKKILDIMNVEGLTREKVASHLQKYRLYLRKVNSGTNVVAGNHIIGSVGGDDSHIGGGYGIYRTLAGTDRFGGFGSMPADQTTGGMLGRFSSASGISFRGLSSPPLLQTTPFPNSFNTNTTAAGGNLLQMNNNNNNNNNNNKPSLPAPPTTTSMMLTEFGNQSSFISSSPNLGRPTWGTTPNMQPQNHNLLPTNNVSAAPAPNAPIQNNNNPLSFFYGGSSSMAMGDPPRGNTQPLNNPGLWQHHKPIYLSSSCNISNTSGSSERGNNNMNMMIDGTSLQFLQQNEGNRTFEDPTLFNDDPQPKRPAAQTTAESLEDIVGRFLTQGTGESAAAQDLELDPFLMK